MSSPATHPTFKPIFEESWSARLRCDVCHYIKVVMTEIVLTVAMWECDVVKAFDKNYNKNPQLIMSWSD